MSVVKVHEHYRLSGKYFHVFLPEKQSPCGRSENIVRRYKVKNSPKIKQIHMELRERMVERVVVDWGRVKERRKC